MAKAKKLPSGSWRVRVYEGKNTDGKPSYRSFTAPTKKEAEYAAAQFALHKRASATPENMTVGEAITRYIDTHEQVLSPSTVSSYRKIRKNNLASIMNVKLRALTDEKIQIAINEESISHAPKTVKNQFALLNAALATYMPDYTPRIKLPQAIKKEMQIPTQAEFAQLLRAVQGTRMEIPVLLAAGMGLRRSEICALEASDYDPVAKTLTINKAMVLAPGNQWVVKAPKTYAGGRTLRVPDPIAAALEQKPLPVSMTPSAISEAYARIKNDLSLPARFHDLRHFHASILLAIGVPDKYAMEIMGHATPAMLKSVYQHTMTDKRASVSNAINDAIENLISPKI